MGRLRLPSPSLPDLTFVVLALLIPLIRGGPLLNSDGDLGRHIRVGEYILTHGLLHRDIFSFTKEGQTFVGYEWLSEALNALVYRLGGLPLVSVACGLLLGFTYAYLCWFMLRRGVDPFLAYVVTLIAAVIGSSHWLARPHLFTYLGVALVMGRLEKSEEGAKPWTYLPIFAIWANLHGGFLYGLVLIGLYLAGDLAEALSPSTRAYWLARARRHAAALGFGALGVILNPYGINLPLHVLSWFEKGYLIDTTQEYLSPDFHGLIGKFALALLLLIMGALALSRRRPSWPRLFLILATIATSLIYQRNLPLMAIAALTALALHINDEWVTLPDPLKIRHVFARDSPGRRSGPWSVAVAIPLLLLTLSASPLSQLQLVPAFWNPKTFPVTAVEKGREAGLQGRIYNDFIWGGYLLANWPEQKVFIDGQTDFYGEDIARQHMRIMALSPGWRELMATWKIELVLVPSTVVAGPRAGTGPGLADLPLRFDRGAPTACRGATRFGVAGAESGHAREGPHDAVRPCSELRGRAPPRSPAVLPAAPPCRGRRWDPAPPSRIPSPPAASWPARFPVEGRSAPGRSSAPVPRGGRCVPPRT